MSQSSDLSALRAAIAAAVAGGTSTITAPITGAFLVPIVAGAPQTFSMSLGGIATSIKVAWNDVAAAWYLDISDAAGVPIIQGIPLVCGSNLLEQFAYLNLGGQLFAGSTFDLSVPPTFENIGTDAFLYFTVPQPADQSA